MLGKCGMEYLAERVHRRSLQQRRASFMHTKAWVFRVVQRPETRCPVSVQSCAYQRGWSCFSTLRWQRRSSRR